MATVIQMLDVAAGAWESARWFFHQMYEVLRETALEHPLLMAIAVFIGCTAAGLVAL